MHEPKKISLSIDGEIWKRFKEYISWLQVIDKFVGKGKEYNSFSE